jgi:hypothetical protein
MVKVSDSDAMYVLNLVSTAYVREQVHTHTDSHFNLL